MTDTINLMFITRSMALSSYLTNGQKSGFSGGKLFSRTHRYDIAHVQVFPAQHLVIFTIVQKQETPQNSRRPPAGWTRGPGPRQQLREHSVQFNPAQTGLGRDLRSGPAKSLPSDGATQNTPQGWWQWMVSGIFAKVHRSVGLWQTRQTSHCV